jgi:hypothetical protein
MATISSIDLFPNHVHSSFQAYRKIPDKLILLESKFRIDNTRCSAVDLFPTITFKALRHEGSITISVELAISLLRSNWIFCCDMVCKIHSTPIFTLEITLSGFHMVDGQCCRIWQDASKIST